MNDYHIRVLLTKDIDSGIITGIEKFACQHPWPEEDIRRVNNARESNGLVAMLGEMIVGYVLYTPNPSSIELLHLAVEKRMHRKGVGSAIIKRLVGKLSAERRRRIFATVRESNLAA